jgi:1-acyl-sn-glycerol-3-phosphate acyltransferase
MKYPFLPNWMLLLNCLFMDRKDMKQSLKTILEAIAKVKGGVSMWIFPEGTRNRGELLDMLPFKEGSLKIAEKSKCPVVPVAITGTAELLEAHAPWVHPGDVTIRFGEPFRIADLPSAVLLKHRQPRHDSDLFRIRHSPLLPKQNLYHDSVLRMTILQHYC